MEKKWKLIQNEYFIIFIISTIILFIRIAVFYDIIPMKYIILLYPISFVSLTILWNILKFINRTLEHYLPYESKNIILRTIIELLGGLVLGFIFVKFAIFLAQDYFKFFELDKKLLVSAYISLVLAILLVDAGFVALYYFKKWKETLLKTERLEKEKAQVQFDNLKNQLNPHFLFNSLTSLNSLIFENQTLASQFLQQLSKVFRYLLQNKDKELVSLETELAFIKNYIFLLETRFQGMLKIHLAIPENQKDKKIVPVTMQILIENAIKHNVIAPEKVLQIDIFTENDKLMIQNNLQKKSLVETSNKQGLENLKSLYAFLSEKSVEIDENEQSFTVKIPLLL